MNINKNNYEAFFLDYHEGNLSPQQVADLLLFVEQHPELKEEFESFENVTLDDLSNVSFENKSSLKKEITLDNREEYFIRAVENTLTSAEKNLLDTFIKQHPKFLPELELFQKTKVLADASVVFENKESLKKNLTPALSTSSVLRTPSPKEKETTTDLQKWDDLLIASIEGTLSSQETIFLNQQLAVDAEMQNNYSLFKQTKLVADTTIVFENKEELKRNLTLALSKGKGENGGDDQERKIVPFFYYVAAAASIALLIGLFFIYTGNKNSEPGLADKTNEEKIVPIENNNSNAVVKNIQPSENNILQKNQMAVSTTNTVKNKNHNNNNTDSTLVTPIIINEQPVLPIAINENKKEITQEKTVLANNEQTTKSNNVTEPTKNDPIANIFDKSNSIGASKGYLSLRELATEKIKEKTLDNETLAMQKKNGRVKRFSGWDFAQIITRGISKATGRDVEVKPTYNNEGDVTAYALGGGLQITRGK